MRAIRYIDGTYPKGTVLTKTQLADLGGTPLDPDIEKRGATIEFPVALLDFDGREIRQVRMPPAVALREGELIILSRIQSSVQNLLMALEEYDPASPKTKRLLQVALQKYQELVLDVIFGKKGFLSRSILGNRIPRSGRAVLLPSEDPDPMVVHVPATMMRRIRVRDGGLVVVGRDPVIWYGGIEILRAKESEEEVIRLHPLVFRQLGGDCDGDQVWIAAVPPSSIPESERKVGGFVRRNGKWPVPMSSSGTRVDWENVGYQGSLKTEPDGFSIGPEDILGGTEEMEDCERILRKEVASECRQAALGYDVETWKRKVLEVNRAQLVMKTGMGPVGAAAMYLRILAGDDCHLKRSANVVSERLAQKLLSHKRAKKKGESYDHQDCLDLLNRRKPWDETEREEAATALAMMLGLEPRHVRPIVYAIWRHGQGLTALIKDRNPLFTATTGRASHRETALELAKRIFIDRRGDPDGPVPFMLRAIERARSERASEEGDRGTGAVRIPDPGALRDEGGHLLPGDGPAHEAGPRDAPAHALPAQA